MNSEEIEKLRIYRRQGYSYGEISKILNISKSTVASHCRREEIKPTVCKKESKTSSFQKDDNVFCKYCGNKLIQLQRGQSRKFCSTACRRSWWKENEDELNKKAFYLITCKYCNKLFEAYGNKNRKYCSHECYVEEVFTQKRERIKDINKIIIEFYNEIYGLTSCKRTAVCTAYTCKILSKTAINKVISKYCSFIYELQNKGKEVKQIDSNYTKNRAD